MIQREALSANEKRQYKAAKQAWNDRFLRSGPTGETFIMNKLPTDAGDQVPRGTLLIVDDTAAMLDMLYDLFTRLGYGVQTVSDGPAAVRAAQAQPPDLVLLDIDLPGLDGFDVCRQLKGNQKTQNIPVIFMSGSEVTRSKARAFEVGGSDYLVKPFRIREVIGMVEVHLPVAPENKATN